jgi:GTP-binding protein
MLVDEVKIRIKAGDGGRGSVAFDKNKMAIGPTGGSGGTGGSIFFEGVSDLGALRQFRFRKELEAQNGEIGRGQFVDGKTGQDLILKVPVGTVIKVENTDKSRTFLQDKKGLSKTSAKQDELFQKVRDKEFEITKIGEKIMLAKGGHGGKGNFLFRSPRNTSPKQFQEGLLGERKELQLELKLIADIGFVGYPNVGKSSLLNELTNAKSKVANYHFTTLEPNLGVYYELILADIPGLIEGASDGKGLGTKFLRHIDRTKIIFHFISSESETPMKDYKIIRKELGKYDKKLLEKKEYLFLSKSDILSEKELKKKMEKMKKLNKNALAISIIDEKSMEKIKKLLNKIKDEKITHTPISA